MAHRDPFGLAGNFFLYKTLFLRANRGIFYQIHQIAKHVSSARQRQNRRMFSAFLGLQRTPLTRRGAAPGESQALNHSRASRLHRRLPRRTIQ
jgi:hypothetical protein